MDPKSKSSTKLLNNKQINNWEWALCINSQRDSENTMHNMEINICRLKIESNSVCLFQVNIQLGNEVVHFIRKTNGICFASVRPTRWFEIYMKYTFNMVWIWTLTQALEFAAAKCVAEEIPLKFWKYLANHSKLYKSTWFGQWMLATLNVYIWHSAGLMIQFRKNWTFIHSIESGLRTDDFLFPMKF